MPYSELAIMNDSDNHAEALLHVHLPGHAQDLLLSKKLESSSGHSYPQSHDLLSELQQRTSPTAPSAGVIGGKPAGLSLAQQPGSFVQPAVHQQALQQQQQSLMMAARGGVSHVLGSSPDNRPEFAGLASDLDVAEPAEKQLCTFFLRTGTCAYGDRCKFKHPEDRPPPTLNTRGYPLRGEEPDCAHYLKKGWCAFGLTCKFNHPEMGPATAMLSPYSLAAAQTVPYHVNVGPSAAYPPNLYSMAAPPAVYYLPNSIGPTQLAQIGGPSAYSSGPSLQGYGNLAGMPTATPGLYMQNRQSSGSFGGNMMMMPQSQVHDQDQLVRAMQTLRMQAGGSRNK